MSNFHLIRTAVNLCLIAAMVIQPMAFAAARGTCAQGGLGGNCCQAKTVCHGCKSCEVKADGDLCGCCSGVDDDAGSCCTKKAKAKPERDDLDGEISDVVPEPLGSSEFIPNAGAEDNGLNSVLHACMCGVQSVPFIPTPTRVAVLQVRDLVVIAYLDHVATDAGKTIRPEALKSRLPFGNLSPHFSQRFLCIWRI